MMTLPPAPETVDARTVERLRRFGGTELVRDMIDLFLTHVPVRVEAARRGPAAADDERHHLAALDGEGVDLGGGEDDQIAGEVVGLRQVDGDVVGEAEARQ